MFGKDDDVSILNSLITTTIDSADGFERSAENARSPSLKQMFEEFGRERRQVVAQLQQQVRALGGTPDDDGSIKAGLHRRWEDLKAAMSADDDRAVIEEVETGEDYLKEKYEAALRDDNLSAASRSVVQQCFESVRRGHDRASQLKHTMQGNRI